VGDQDPELQDKDGKDLRLYYIIHSSPSLRGNAKRLVKERAVETNTVLSIAVQG